MSPNLTSVMLSACPKRLLPVITTARTWREGEWGGGNGRGGEGEGEGEEEGEGRLAYNMCKVYMLY